MKTIFSSIKIMLLNYWEWFCDTGATPPTETGEFNIPNGFYLILITAFIMLYIYNN